MTKTKKKYLIISLLTVIFAAVICAFTIQPPQAVHAADSSDSIFGSVVPYYNFTIREDMSTYDLSFGCDLNNLSDPNNTIYCLFLTTDRGKYTKAVSSDVSYSTSKALGVIDPLRSEVDTTNLKLIEADSFASSLTDYTDYFYSYSRSYNDFQSRGAAISRYNRFSVTVPIDEYLLDHTFYFYFAKFDLKKRIDYGQSPVLIDLYYETLYSTGFTQLVEVNLRDEMYSFLETDLSYDFKHEKFQRILGIYTGSKVMPITVKYKYCAGYGDIRETEKSFTMDSLYGQCKDKAVEAMYNQVEGLNDITSFNCVYKDSKWLSNGDKLDFGDKVILQAKDFTYVYNGSESAVLTVNYEPFNYKDFSIRVTNNDESNNLTLDIYTANVSEDTVNYTLKFNYADMNRWLSNKAGWLVELKKDLFNADGVIVNKSSKVNVTVGDKDLMIKVAKAEQNSLSDLRICVVAEIVEDKEITYTVNYMKLSIDDDGMIIKENVSMNPAKCSYSLYLRTLTNFDNFMNGFGDTVNAAVAPTELEGIGYCTPSNVSSVSVGNLEYNLNVLYTYRTILRVSENGVFKRFVQLDHYNNQYSLSDLGVVVPDGFRVSNIFSDNRMSIDFDDKNPDNAILTSNVNLYKDIVVDINIEMTDSILVNLDYLENYLYTDENGTPQASGFAQKATLYKEVPANFFADVYEPTLEELKTYTGLEDMSVVGAFGTVKTDATIVKKIGSVYNIKLSYNKAFLKQIDSLGGAQFTSIPISSYSEWCDSFGYDWSIQALNTEEKVCFKEDGAVRREDLYGYFYVAVFKEQVKNLDELFAGYTAGGCRTFFSMKEVQGSFMYKLCSEMGLIGAVITFGGSKVYQAVEESTFGQDSGTYYSYFMFVDGSSTLNYAANNKAKDYFNNKSAAENTFDQAKEDIAAWWNSNNGIVKGIKAVLGVLLIVGVAICVIYLIPVFAGGIGKASKAITQVKNDTKNKSGITHKKPVKKYKSHKTKRK